MTTQRPTPPSPMRRPHTRKLHGTVVDDPWFWLRDRDDPETIAHLEAENAYVAAGQAHLGDLRERLFEEIRSRVKETDDSVPVPKGPYEYLIRQVEGAQYPIHVRTPRGGGDEQIVLDENREAGDSEYFAVGDLAVSPDHSLVAFTTDRDGDEQYELHVREIATGRDLPDTLSGLSYGLAWASDNATLYVTTTDDAARPDRVLRHRLGDDPSTAPQVFHEPDERFWVGVGSARSERFIVIGTESKNTSEYWLIDAADPDSAARCVEPRREGHEYRIDHQGDRLLIVTNDGAENFRLVSAPLDDPRSENWSEIVAHRPNTRIEDADAYETFFVVTERTRAQTSLVVHDLALDQTYTIEMDEDVYEVGPGSNAEYDARRFRFGYTSMVTPQSTFELDLDTRERTLLKQQPVLGDFEQADYATKRIWAIADDGSEIPISLVWHREQRKPEGPLLLYGYGAYEIVMPAGFSAIRPSLLDRGVTFAIAHIRGGGELGRSWYEQGRLANKLNSFTDFIRCAEHLIDAGWTTSDRLVARGGSAGGLLMGGVANMRPELFAGIVAEVPFVDNVNTMLDATLPLTVTEYDEWGNPNEAEAFGWMMEYGPYENVREVGYPAILATGGLNDPRVPFWEPAKWVAKLRETGNGNRPIYLKTEMGAGHGGPSGRYDTWRDEAYVLAFVLDVAGGEAR